MSGTIVGILGFLCIVAIVLTLFKSKTLPSIAFIVFPTILALILVFGGYYSLDNIAELIKSVFSSTAPTAALFVLALRKLKVNRLEGNFLEGMACEGGCVQGAGCFVRSPKNRMNVETHAKQADGRTILGSIQAATQASKAQE